MLQAAVARTGDEIAGVCGEHGIPYPAPVPCKRLHGGQVMQARQLDGAVRAADGEEAGGKKGDGGVGLRAGAVGEEAGTHVESGLRVQRSV